MNTQDTLLAYSEWLDSQGLVKTDSRDTEHTRIVNILEGKTVTGSGGQRLYMDRGTAEVLADVLVMEPDKRSHDDLAREFIEQWDSGDRTAPLAGASTDGRSYPAMMGLASTKELIGELNARALVSEKSGEDWPHYRTVNS